MSKTPSQTEVHQLLAAIDSLREIPKIAFAARYSREFEQLLSRLIADAGRELKNIPMTDGFVVRDVYAEFRSRLPEIVREGMSTFELGRNSQVANSDLCESEHRRIVAGRCPWCGKDVEFGKTRAQANLSN